MWNKLILRRQAVVSVLVATQSVRNHPRDAPQDGLGQSPVPKGTTQHKAMEKGIHVNPGTLLIQILEELVQEFLEAYPKDANFKMVYERAKEERPHNLK
jgi:hypothetical protein